MPMTMKDGKPKYLWAYVGYCIAAGLLTWYAIHPLFERLGIFLGVNHGLTWQFLQYSINLIVGFFVFRCTAFYFIARPLAPSDTKDAASSTEPAGPRGGAPAGQWKCLLWVLCLSLLAVVVINVVAAFSRAWEKMTQMDCQTGLSHLGLLCYAYADHNGGSFPSRWSDLATVDYATNAQYFCPSAGHTAGKWASVDLWADYRLVPNLRTSAPPDTVLAIEPLANHHGEGANVLFTDGRVQWWTAVEIENWQGRINSPEPKGPRDGSPAAGGP